jgi:hypothetical protein
MLTIRHARASSASVNARQTISTGALSWRPARKGIFLMAAAVGLRMVIDAIVIRQKQQRPRHAEAFEADP